MGRMVMVSRMPMLAPVCIHERRLSDLVPCQAGTGRPSAARHMLNRVDSDRVWWFGALPGWGERALAGRPQRRTAEVLVTFGSKAAR